MGLWWVRDFISIVVFKNGRMMELKVCFVYRGGKNLFLILEERDDVI